MPIDEDKDYKCEDCNNTLVVDNNILYCPKCGLVVDDEPVDFGREHIDKEFSNIQRKSRNGPPVTYLNPFSRTNM